MFLNKEKFDYIYFYLTLLIPFSLIFGPIYGELIIALSIIYFFIFRNDFKINKFIIIFFVFLIFAFLLNIINFIYYEKFYNFSTFFKPIIYLRFLIFFVVLNYLFNKFEFKIYYNFMFLLFIILSFYILYTFINIKLNNINFNITSKIQFNFFDKQILGYYILLFSPLPIFYYSNKYYKNVNEIAFKNYLIIFISILIISSIFLVGEKNTFLKLCLFLFLLFMYALFNLQNKRILPFIILLFFLCLILLYHYTNIQIFYSPIFDFIINLVTFDLNLQNDISEKNIHNNFFHYIILYKNAFQIFIDNPVIANGIKTFRINCNLYEYGQVLNQYRCSTHPHNYILEILSETGIIGLFLFFLFFYNVYLNFLRINKNSLNYIALFIIIIILFPVLPTGSFFNNYNSIIFWFILSMVFSGNLLKK